jgi:hypothetical protein
MVKMDISLDVEACGEVLLSIGACTFNPYSGTIGNQCSWVFPIQEQLDLGLKMDGKTFTWWLQQSEFARRALVPNGTLPPLQECLEHFAYWMDPLQERKVWAYPASYDLPLIARVFGAAKIRVPWKWTKTMCARTLWHLACERNPQMQEIEKVENPNQHVAVDDAVEQAGWITKYLSAVRT